MCCWRIEAWLWMSWQILERTSHPTSICSQESACHVQSYLFAYIDISAHTHTHTFSRTHIFAFVYGLSAIKFRCAFLVIIWKQQKFGKGFIKAPRVAHIAMAHSNNTHTALFLHIYANVCFLSAHTHTLTRKLLCPCVCATCVWHLVQHHTLADRPHVSERARPTTKQMLLKIWLLCGRPKARQTRQVAFAQNAGELLVSWLSVHLRPCRRPAVLRSCKCCCKPTSYCCCLSLLLPSYEHFCATYSSISPLPGLHTRSSTSFV